MENIVFYPCDKDITRASNLQLSRNILPCAQCGSSEHRLGAGKGPHSASLRCAVCDRVALLRSADRFIRWIGKSELARIEAAKGVQ